ncbi:MAG TPA: UDP-3-O-acyl-N-acetylglucosamine deacetylase, partial [Fibrobacteraceae bacterium]|nr:UDP-3-O-acyl-N-acetylglucosamine deacetylase [Fibrobacteraceae bacterium]
MIQLQGIGLQCGHSVPVQITRANPGSGHVWTVSPQATPVLCTKIRTEVQWSAERTTILHYAGASLRTPEHLAAALLGWPHCD